MISQMVNIIILPSGNQYHYTYCTYCDINNSDHLPILHITIIPLHVGFYPKNLPVPLHQNFGPSLGAVGWWLPAWFAKCFEETSRVFPSKICIFLYIFLPMWHLGHCMSMENKAGEFADIWELSVWPISVIRLEQPSNRRSAGIGVKDPLFWGWKLT